MRLIRAFVLGWIAHSLAARDPLPSWHEGQAKQSILGFVSRVTKQGGADFISPAARIAVFDDDGTLWCEQPLYVQAAFALDRAGKPGGVLEERAAAELMKSTHAGMTTREFESIVKDWLTRAKHPRFHRPYTDLVYQPMLEVLAFLRENSFKTYIVSGGGAEFMRAFAERVYGVPPEQVIGTAIKLQYAMRDGIPVLLRLPEIDFVDDKAGKPIAIQRVIGRRPVFAAGNSDGDVQMLEWTTAPAGPNLGLIVHHTDSVREWAYDRQSSIGRLDRALTEAPNRGWLVVDMKKNWKTIFSPDRRSMATCMCY